MSKVLEYFKEISKYPRPSKQEEKVRNFLVDFFTSKWFKNVVDKTWNLIVYVPKKNSSSDETIILQCHMDMVCVKTSESNHNFLTDPINYYEKDWYLYAKETTLWADNGIWIAYCMSVIDYESYPNLELVFTIDEEAWMSWASWLDFSLLKWTKIINLDNEDDNDICISSAWGIWISWNKALEFEKWVFQKFDIEIFWMKWWHSWIEINENRWNAIILLIDFLNKYNWELELYRLNSWFASNVIPSKINITLWIKEIQNFEESFSNYIKDVKNIFDCPSLEFRINTNDSNLEAIKNWINLLKIFNWIKNWVYKMSDKIDWLVETSINLWILKIENNSLFFNYLLRSSNNEDLTTYTRFTQEYFENIWFVLSFDRWYLWWQDDPNSKLVKIAKEEYKNITWKNPNVIALHAWLECGTLVSWLNNTLVNAISIWPSMQFVHSIKERVEIASVLKIEEILKNILRRL